MDKIDEIQKKIQNGIKITASEHKALIKHTIELIRSIPGVAQKAIDEGRWTDEMYEAFVELNAIIMNATIKLVGKIPPELKGIAEKLIQHGYQIDEPEHKERKDNIKLVRRKKSTTFRNKIIQRFGRQCFNCGDVYNLNIDHHFPAKDWNELNENNAVVLCESCNKQKGTKVPEDFYTYGHLSVLNGLYDIAKTALEVSEDSLPESISAFDIYRFIQQKK